MHMHLGVYYVDCAISNPRTMPSLQKATLLEVLQLRSRHADASLRLAQAREKLEMSASISTTAPESRR